MKKMKRSELYVQLKKYALVLLLLVAISACKEDDEPKKQEEGDNEITLNGGPYTNLTAKSNTFGTGGYSKEDDVTAIVYTVEDDAGDSFIVTISFPGNKTGEKNWDFNGGCYVQMGHDFKGTSDYIVVNAYDQSSGSFVQLPGVVNIDRYGEVGGIISGSFEGECTFSDTRCGNCIKKGTMKGSFEVTRTPDL